MNKDRTWLVIESHPYYGDRPIRFTLTELGAYRVAARLNLRYAGVGYRYRAEQRKYFYRTPTKENLA